MKISELKKLCEEAHAEVSALCKGKEWRMCIPVRQDDSDELIGGALRKMDKLIAVAEAAKELEQFLTNDIGMDKTELTWVRSALKDLESE